MNHLGENTLAYYSELPVLRFQERKKNDLGYTNDRFLKYTTIEDGRIFLDIYKQVSSRAGAYQIMDVHNGVMLNIGGSGITNYVYIVGENYAS